MGHRCLPLPSRNNHLPTLQQPIWGLCPRDGLARDKTTVRVLCSWKLRAKVSLFRMLHPQRWPKSTQGEGNGKVICLNEMDLRWSSSILWEMNRTIVQCLKRAEEMAMIKKFIYLFNAGAVSLLLLRIEFSYIYTRH